MSETPETQQREQESSQTIPEDEEVRIGVYTCYCGGNISDVVDCEKVAGAMRRLPNVVVSRTDMSMCSDAGQAMIEEGIPGHRGPCRLESLSVPPCGYSGAR